MVFSAPCASENLYPGSVLEPNSQSQPLGQPQMACASPYEEGLQHCSGVASLDLGNVSLLILCFQFCHSCQRDALEVKIRTSHSAIRNFLVAASPLQIQSPLIHLAHKAL